MWYKLTITMEDGRTYEYEKKSKLELLPFRLRVLENEERAKKLHMPYTKAVKFEITESEY